MDILSTILPLFLLGLTGWLTSRLAVFSPEHEAGLSKLIFSIALPAAAFRGLYQADLEQTIEVPFCQAYLLSIAILYFTTLLVVHIWSKRGLTESILLAMNTSLSNSGVIAMPILIALYQQQGLLIGVQIMLVTAVVLPFLLASIEYSLASRSHRQPQKVLFTTLKKSLSQPFVCCILAALICKTLLPPLPTFVFKYLAYLAALLVPCAFLAAGMKLQYNSNRSVNTEIILISVISAFIKPLLALLLAGYFQLSSQYAMALVVISAAPVSNTVSVIASRYRVYHEESSNILFITSLFALVSLPFYSTIIDHLW